MGVASKKEKSLTNTLLKTGIIRGTWNIETK